MKIIIYNDTDACNPRDDDNFGTFYMRHGRYAFGDSGATPPAADDIALPVYMYDHSGITINTTGYSCPWDSGMIGYIYVSKTRARLAFGWHKITRKRRAIVEKYLRDEIELLDFYVSGNIYGYILQDDGETVDAIGGFYGPDPLKNGMVDYIGTEVYAQCDIVMEV